MPSTRVAIVTGASGDLGKYISTRLAEDGLDIAVNDLPSKKDDLAMIVAEIKSKGRKATVVLGDVSVEADVQSIVEKAVSELGSVDVVSLPQF